MHTPETIVASSVEFLQRYQAKTATEQDNMALSGGSRSRSRMMFIFGSLAVVARHNTRSFFLNFAVRHEILSDSVNGPHSKHFQAIIPPALESGSVLGVWDVSSIAQVPIGYFISSLKSPFKVSGPPASELTWSWAKLKLKSDSFAETRRH